MTQKQASILEAIKKEAISTDWYKTFDGKSAGNRHLERVNKIAEYLQSKEGGDLFIVLSAAWVHDVTLAYKLDDSPSDISLYTKKFLEDLNILEEVDIDKIVQAVSGHESGSLASIEGQIVHDADVVDKSGVLGVIRHIWKMTNMIHNRILDKQSDLDELQSELKRRESKLFTDTAKKLVMELNKSRDYFFADTSLSLQLMSYISKKAFEGIITEEIAKDILTNFDNDITKYISIQLECKYLI